MSKLKYWTGIGSREVTPDIAKLQFDIGVRLAKLGWVLMSGGANGSDYNFQAGVCSVDPSLADIYIPWSGFNLDVRLEGNNYICPDNNDFHIAKEYLIDNEIICWFDNMKQGTQKLHARNYFQIYGSYDVHPQSNVVIYAAPEDNKGNIKGGTRSAVMVGRKEKLPCYNLMLQDRRDRFLEQLTKIEERNERS